MTNLVDPSDNIYEVIEFQILNRPFSIRCKRSEIKDLYESIHKFEACVNNLKPDRRNLNIIQVLVIAGLNLCQQLHRQEKENNQQMLQLNNLIQTVTEQLDETQEHLLKVTE